MEDVFVPRQIRHFDFDVEICKVLFLFCTLTWRVNFYVSRQGKGINRGIENEDLDFSVISL